jgi:uncharacterized membrane protein
MESRAKLFGHAIHPIMIVFPLGLLATGVIFDIVYRIWGGTTFSVVAHWMIIAGIIGGFLAAPFGWIDWFAIPANTRAKSIGLMHGLTNSVVLLFFIGSWWMRSDSPDAPETMAGVLAYVGGGLALLGGWLGGELVERLGVGVDDGANLNAPNSLSGKPASATEAKVESV